MSKPTNETDHDAPRRSPPRPSTYAPIEVDDPRLRDVERRMAEQDATFRQALEAISRNGRALVPFPREEMDAFQELCTPTKRALPVAQPLGFRC